MPTSRPIKDQPAAKWRSAANQIEPVDLDMFENEAEEDDIEDAELEKEENKAKSQLKKEIMIEKQAS